MLIRSPKARWSAGLLTAVMMAGCADAPQGPTPDDAQRDELLHRASQLQDRVRASEGEPTAADRLEFESIRTEMMGWSELTGRTDLKVCDEEEQRLVSAALIDTGRPGPGRITCQPCPSVTYQFGMLCFLVDQQCDPFTGSRFCVYNCIPTTHPWLS